MRRIIITILLSAAFMAALSVYIAAQPNCKLKPTHTFMLYPEGQSVDKGLEGALGPGESNGITDPEWLNEHGAKAEANEADAKRYQMEQEGILQHVHPKCSQMRSPDLISLF